MKKSIYSTLQIILLFIVISCKNENDYGDKMVYDFYKNYLTEIASSKDMIKMEKSLDSLKKENCTKMLLDSIKNEFELNELDYDPFIKAQDSNLEAIKSLSVKKISESSNTFLVSYFDSYNKSTIKIKVQLKNESGKFRISSIK